MFCFIYLGLFLCRFDEYGEELGVMDDGIEHLHAWGLVTIGLFVLMSLSYRWRLVWFPIMSGYLPTSWLGKY